MKLALVTTLLLAAAPAVADDALIATLDSNDLAVSRVKATGLDKVFVEKASKAVSFGWADARTLWVLYESPISLVKLVDGKVAEKITVLPATFKLPANTDPDPKLLLTTKAEVWLQACSKYKGETGDDSQRCVKGSWVRVDTKVQTQQAKKPAGIDDYRVSNSGLGTAPAFPKIKAPAGYTVTLKQVVADGVGDDQKKTKAKGAVCKGPTSSKTWPDNTVDIPFAMKPSRVTWLRASPSIVKIDGKATNPIGDIEQHEAVFVDCKDLVDEARWLGAGAWALRTESKWTIYLEDKKIATITAEYLRAAPSK
ncbi:MAG: hypothetical protein H0V17_04205 [Deltaproteobacteria bacterium]|nr:hypothetical protein [Deltaproteobacteria bacterium]